MLITEIKCKTTAPMFIAGADTEKPEIRAASVKGVMRYIWRAVQCAPDVKSLREAEGRLFGNADGESTTVSPLKLQVIEEKVSNENPERVVMLPHRNLPE